MRTFLSLLCGCCLIVTFCQAAEIDTVTRYPKVLPDATATLNAIFNARLQEGIDAANARQNGIVLFSKAAVCDEERLYAELRKAIFQSFSGGLGLQGYSLDKQLREQLSDKSYSLPLEESIYRDITFFEGISLNLKELSSVVRVQGQLIGLDKIGHFFAEGWSYFHRTTEDEATLPDVMEWGKDLEKGKFGYLTTGIFSYADLVANFNGYRFWNGLRKRHRDPLKGVVADFFSSPQISCNLDLVSSLKKRKIVRQWILRKPFDLAEYIDGSWSEENNCNSYSDLEIEEKVAARSAEAHPGFLCPAESGVCVQAGKKYGRYAEDLLHPKCLSAGGSK